MGRREDKREGEEGREGEREEGREGRKKKGMNEGRKRGRRKDICKAKNTLGLSSPGPCPLPTLLLCRNILWIQVYLLFLLIEGTLFVYVYMSV